MGKKVIKDYSDNIIALKTEIKNYDDQINKLKSERVALIRKKTGLTTRQFNNLWPYPKSGWVKDIIPLVDITIPNYYGGTASSTLKKGVKVKNVRMSATLTRDYKEIQVWMSVDIKNKTCIGNVPASSFKIV